MNERDLRGRERTRFFLSARTDRTRERREEEEEENSRELEKEDLAAEAKGVDEKEDTGRE